MMVPVGRLVVLRTTAKSELIKAIAYLTWPALVAPVHRPGARRRAQHYASWRWIFLINVPLGVVGLFFARRLVPDVRGPEAAPAGLARLPAHRSRGAALVIGMEQIGTAGRTGRSSRSRWHRRRRGARRGQSLPAARPAPAAGPAHPADRHLRVTVAGGTVFRR